ncbi:MULTISPECIES: CDP-alcohol phosphatidyltransferase family protein [Flavobacteriaceae]|uniref:Phosphatidylserine synthase n=2 Tax=Flavobacteriaceae TaxID=49546 RepID=A0A4Y8AWI4_9FLAO|nr:MULTISPECIES: CDP-alcohol phosphatidyltransferase family protein [Flavobacteriaceae]TEW76368.1 phosphatidylserine synthase [Gramella jeungdoensis]GGK52313.1 phosphatidylserine synthase [Lutibacter litoralis]
MMLKKYIPNLLTLLNLLCGTIAVIFAVNNELELAAYLVLLGIFFDFFDGFAARIFSVEGELGKQLDSLADVVTSGVVPGIVVYKLLQTKKSIEIFNTEIVSWKTEDIELLPFLGLIFTLAAAYRLAKFNIDERQTSSFIGLPTPAAALVVLSLPLILNYSSLEFATTLIENKWFLIGLTAVLSFLMNAEIPLFSLKFKDYSWKNNRIKYVFLILTIILVISLQFIAIPLVILLYILLSIFFKELK